MIDLAALADEAQINWYEKLFNCIFSNVNDVMIAKESAYVSSYPSLNVGDKSTYVVCGITEKVQDFIWYGKQRPNNESFLTQLRVDISDSVVYEQRRRKALPLNTWFSVSRGPRGRRLRAAIGQSIFEHNRLYGFDNNMYFSVGYGDYELVDANSYEELFINNDLRI